MTNQPTLDPVRAYYFGRNSVDDDGSLLCDSPFTSPELQKAWKEGVRDMKAELRLSAEPEMY